MEEGMTKNFLGGLLVIFLSASTFAEEYVLLPISVAGEIPGAFESRWISELVITNTAEHPIEIQGIDSGCRIPPCLPPMLPPRATVFPFAGPLDPAIPASLLLVQSQDLADLSIQLRVQDLSRQAQTWGTEIPVITEQESFTGALHLLNVPLTAEFRQLLRVYAFPPAVDGEIRIRAYRVDQEVRFPDEAHADALLVEQTLSLRGSVLESVPAYAQLDFHDLQIGFPTAERIRLEIEPVASDLRYWAFVSVTNNATQHVTTITPQP
jgi:hypothetical protein